MAAEIGPKEEPVPDSSRYDREEVNRRIFEEAGEFEETLNVHVDPWIALFARLVWSRLFLGLAAFIVLVPLSIAVFMAADGPLWLPFAIAGSPLVLAVWTGIREDWATTSGKGAEPSEGLSHTRARLAGILEKQLDCLGREKDVGESRVENRRNHSAVKALSALCTLRMKGLLIHQKAFRRVNVLNEVCDKLLLTTRIIAFVAPLVLVLLAAAIFVSPLLLWDVNMPWATWDVLGGAVLLTLTGLIFSFLPFWMVYRYARRIQRKLVETLETNWKDRVKPSDFDSTGAMATQFEWVLDQWAECERSWQNRHTNPNHR